MLNCGAISNKVANYYNESTALINKHFIMKKLGKLNLDDYSMMDDNDMKRVLGGTDTCEKADKGSCSGHCDPYSSGYPRSCTRWDSKTWYGWPIWGCSCQ